MVRCDDEIMKDVAEELFWDNRVDTLDVLVEVANGKVKLTGTVPTHSAKSSAGQDVFNVPGVTAVENGLEVIYTPTVALQSDARINRCIENSLSTNPDIDATRIRVLVYAGWVTLEGIVDSYWKKIKAEDIAASIIGVMGITNKLGIVPTEEFLDNSIAMSIIAGLDQNSSVDVDSVDVRVEGGTVVLSGVVSSWAAYHAAQEIAEHTKGVHEVTNRLLVA